MISPSPWSVSEKRVYVKDAEGENVCAVSRHDDCALIAAAPDLLRELKALTASAALDETYEEAMARFYSALTAIAKAEGR